MVRKYSTELLVDVGGGNGEISRGRSRLSSVRTMNQTGYEGLTRLPRVQEASGSLFDSIKTGF